MSFKDRPPGRKLAPGLDADSIIKDAQKEMKALAPQE